MTKGKPEKVIKLLNKLITEKDDSKKGNIQLEIGQETQKLLFVSDDITVQAFYSKLIQLGTKEYLESNGSEMSKENINTLIDKLNECLVYTN